MSVGYYGDNYPVLELCAAFIVSAACKSQILVGGGGASPVQKDRRRRRGSAWLAKFS